MTARLQPDELPALPRLVFRVGFAGNRDVPADKHNALVETLKSVLHIIAKRLAEIAPGVPIHGPGPELFIAKFYSSEALPLLRLITGLAEGADTLAAKALSTAVTNTDLQKHLETELAAVLPFGPAEYRASREDDGFRPVFDQQAKACRYIVALDGRHEKPSPDTNEHKKRRARAYRCQSTVLLRHCELLVAAANPDNPAKAGGAMETVRTALVFQTPVLFVNTVSQRIWLLEPGQDVTSELADDPPTIDDLQKKLGHIITKIVAIPDKDLSAYGQDLLSEFFHATDLPPMTFGDNGKQGREIGELEQHWSEFETTFRPPGARGPKSDPPLRPYSDWRKRSTELNYHYSGLYRGTFLVNYELAVAAVALATISLALLATVHSPARSLILALLLMASAKLYIVLMIAKNTRRANDGKWNDKAVDYRYLAERLRTMLYLPRGGSFKPPAAAPARYESRAVQQSAAEWLFNAIVRSIAPYDCDFAQHEQLVTEDGTAYQATIIRPKPAAVIQTVRDDWVYQQYVYHGRMARTMERLSTWTEKKGTWLSRAVITVVMVDVVFLIGESCGLFPEWFEHGVHLATPWMILLTAVLPAALASLNGVRFQSECSSLVDRSSVMQSMLCGNDHAKGEKEGRWGEANRLANEIGAAQRTTDNKGSWCDDVLRLSEAIAGDFVEEVKDWSILYAKEVPET